jgi:hypothetical protein
VWRRARVACPVCRARVTGIATLADGNRCMACNEPEGGDALERLACGCRHHGGCIRRMMETEGGDPKCESCGDAVEAGRETLYERYRAALKMALREGTVESRAAMLKAARIVRGLARSNERDWRSLDTPTQMAFAAVMGFMAIKGWNRASPDIGLALQVGGEAVRSVGWTLVNISTVWALMMFYARRIRA